jgi:hypothetical protein
VGDPIAVQAEDDFEVSGVLVRILELDGTEIEQGAAALGSEGGKWKYAVHTPLTAGKAVVIEIRVSDWPGHTAIKRIDHVCGPRS